jgi:hypothetical protein
LKEQLSGKYRTNARLDKFLSPLVYSKPLDFLVLSRQVWEHKVYLRAIVAYLAELKNPTYEGRVPSLWAAAANTIVKLASRHLMYPLYFRVSAEAPLEHPASSFCPHVACRKPEVVGSESPIFPEPEHLQAIVPLELEISGASPRLCASSNAQTLPPWSEVVIPVVILSPKPETADSVANDDDDDDYGMLPEAPLHCHSLEPIPWEPLAASVLEMMSSVGDRRFGYGLLVCGADFEVWYWDRQGGIQSERMSIDDHRFVQVIVALTMHGPAQVGFDPIISSHCIGHHVGEQTTFPVSVVARNMTSLQPGFELDEPVSSSSFRDRHAINLLVPDRPIETLFEGGEFSRVNFTVGEWNFTLGSTLAARRGLLNGGTVVRKSRGYRDGGRMYFEGVCKSSWSQPSKIPEWRYLSKARATGRAAITDHIPGVILAAKLQSTESFRPQCFLDPQEQHIQRILVLEPVCQPIWTLLDPALVKKVFRELVTCKFHAPCQEVMTDRRYPRPLLAVR